MEFVNDLIVIHSLFSMLGGATKMVIDNTKLFGHRKAKALNFNCSFNNYLFFLSRSLLFWVCSAVVLVLAHAGQYS